MAIGDKLYLADKPTLDATKTNTDTIKADAAAVKSAIGTNSSAASATGDVHAKLKDIKSALGGVGGGGSVFYDTPGTRSFTVPTGVNVVYITGVAAGGGGGGSSSSASSSYNGGGGGGGGAGASCFRVPVPVVPGSSHVVTVGSAGSGGSAGNSSGGTNGTSGSSGGATSFGSLLTIAPGSGGSSGIRGISTGSGQGGSRGNPGLFSNRVPDVYYQIGTDATAGSSNSTAGFGGDARTPFNTIGRYGCGGAGGTGTNQGVTPNKGVDGNPGCILIEW